MKKISCIMIAIFSTFIMSISAFALNAQVPSYFDLIYDTKHVDEFLDTGCGEFARAFKNGDFTDILVTAHYYYNEYSNKGYWDEIDIYYFPQGFECSNLKLTTEYNVRYNIFNLDFNKPFEGCSMLSYFDSYPSIYKDTYKGISNQSYILCNFSDRNIVNKIRSLVPSKPLYDIFDTKCKTLKFKDVFIDGVIAKLPPPPPPTNVSNGVIASTCFDGFLKNIIGNINVLIPVLIIFFGLFFSISYLIKIIKRYARG